MLVCAEWRPCTMAFEPVVLYGVLYISLYLQVGLPSFVLIPYHVTPHRTSRKICSLTKRNQANGLLCLLLKEGAQKLIPKVETAH